MIKDRYDENVKWLESHGFKFALDEDEQTLYVKEAEYVGKPGYPKDLFLVRAYVGKRVNMRGERGGVFVMLDTGGFHSTGDDDSAKAAVDQVLSHAVTFTTNMKAVAEKMMREQ